MVNTRRHRKRVVRNAALSRRRVSAVTRIRRKQRKTMRVGGVLFTNYSNNILDALKKTDPSFGDDYETILSEQKCHLDSNPVYNDPRGNDVVQRQRKHEYIQCLITSFDIFLKRHKDKIIAAVKNDVGEIKPEIESVLNGTETIKLQNMIHPPPKSSMFGNLFNTIP